ncbi:helicase [Nitrospiraceae bacterium HYJII51-Mn-bac16s-1-B09]|uniref:Helicase n=2 Tax=Candidatus Manganitrophus noduliformans TaxID=2606439 RepID=A0A7X6DQ08_9BACT|nr:helicase [Candidatus Manganitrophus noduliformans]
MMNIVYFDLETKKSAEEVGGWENKHRMGFSFGVTYSTRDDRFRGYEEEDIPALISELRSADRIVGYNILGFDYSVLSPYTDVNLSALPTLDLMTYLHPILGFRPKLDSLAAATLKAGKTADGLKAIRWYREGNFASIALYCKEDVRITRDLHLYGCRNGFIYYTNRSNQAARVSVVW